MFSLGLTAWRRVDPWRTTSSAVISPTLELVFRQAAGARIRPGTSLRRPLLLPGPRRFVQFKWPEASAKDQSVHVNVLSAASIQTEDEGVSCLPLVVVGDASGRYKCRLIGENTTMAQNELEFFENFDVLITLS